MDYIGIIQPIVSLFVAAMITYFVVDVAYLARQNDRLKKRLGELEHRVRRLER